MLSIRFRLLFLCFLVTALIAPACTSTQPPNEEDLGVVTIDAEQPIKIATLQATSGTFANLGEDQVRGVKLAIANLGGELLDHPIELVEADEGCPSEGGDSSVRALVAQESPAVIGVIGTSCSDTAQVLTSVISAAGMVMISASNTSPSLTASGYTKGSVEQSEFFERGYFRVSTSGEFQSSGIAQFLRDARSGPCDFVCDKLATLNYGETAAGRLLKETAGFFEDLGGGTFQSKSLATKASSIQDVLIEIATGEPDVILFPLKPESNSIVKQIRVTPGIQDTTLVGAQLDGLLLDTFVTDPDTKGVYVSGPALPMSAQLDDFIQKYKNEFGELPSHVFHALAYDATNLLLDAIEDIAELADDGTITIDRAKLRTVLYKTRNKTGLTGRFTCNEFGDCAEPAEAIYLNSDPDVGVVKRFSTPFFVPNLSR